MNIISGKFKGIKIASPHDAATHPMGAREKNALFNMLQPWLADAIVLDAYAGSGALGLEALSRGAKVAVFVEKSLRISGKIRENLASTGLEMPVFVENVANFARNPRFKAYFSLIIADPPYDAFSLDEVAGLTATLQPGGIFALSYPAEFGPLGLPGLTLLTNRRYAAAGIGIYRKNA